jgi:hypothetical protein
MTRLKALRIAVLIMVVLLGAEFELGMAVNLSPSLQEISPPAAPAALWGALVTVGGEAAAHALLGGLLAALAIVIFVLALLCGGPGVAVCGALSFLTIGLASANGILFILSGFRDDNYSHGMATAFLLAFSLHFILLGVLTFRIRRQKHQPS